MSAHLALTMASASDTATGVGIPVAIAAGLVSFLSPCVLPLVPGYLSTVIGVTPSGSPGGRRGPSRARPQPAVHRELLGDLHPAGAQRDGHRVLAEHPQTRPPAGRRGDHRADGRDLPGDPVRRVPQPRVALGGAAAPGGPRRPADSGSGLRDRLDAVHEHHARRDPHTGGRLQLRRPRGAAARLLLGRPGDPVPADRAGLRADDDRAGRRQAPFPRHHRRSVAS